MSAQASNSGPRQDIKFGTCGYETTISDGYMGPFIAGNIDDGSQHGLQGEHSVEAETCDGELQCSGMGETNGHELMENMNDGMVEGSDADAIWDGNGTNVWMGGSTSGAVLEEEADQELVEPEGLMEGSTCVASAPSYVGPHGYESAMLRSETASTMVDVEKMWMRRDDEDETEDPTDFLNVFPGQDLGVVAFSHEPNVQLPPSIFEQVSIIAEQNPDRELQMEEKIEEFLQQSDDAQEEQLQVFYDCLASYGPWFGVTKRLSQEDMFKMRAQGS